MRSELRAGVGWAWTLSDPAHPSSLWTLTYYFKNATNHFEIIAAAGSADSFTINVTATTTVGYAAGRYQWYAMAVAGAAKDEIESGVLVVLPDVQNANVLDQRSHAQKTLAAIEAYLENSSNLTAARYTIGGRELQHYAVLDLVKMRDRYLSEVNAEAAADRIAQGLPARNRILTRL